MQKMHIKINKYNKYIYREREKVNIYIYIYNQIGRSTIFNSPLVPDFPTWQQLLRVLIATVGAPCQATAPTEVVLRCQGAPATPAARGRRIIEFWELGRLSSCEGHWGGDS